MTEEPGIGYNSELTEEQRQALFWHHRRLYINALARKKEADAAFKNTCKKAKAEQVDPAMIKFSIELEGGDPDAMAEEQRKREEVAAWMGLPFGGQADMFDRRPAEEVAFEAGKRAGMSGESCEAPDGYQPEQWVKGWHAGQKALAETLPLFASNDDEAGEGDAEAELIPAHVNAGRQMEEFDDLDAAE